MGVTLGWNALNSHMTSVLLRSGTRFALAVPGDHCTFQGPRTLQGFRFHLYPFVSSVKFPQSVQTAWLLKLAFLCQTYLPAFRVVLVIRCETERNLCPMADPPLMFLEGSALLQACVLIPRWYQPCRWMERVVQPLKGKSKQHLPAVMVFVIRARSLSPFPPAWPCLPVCTNKGKSYSFWWHLEQLVYVFSGHIG